VVLSYVALAEEYIRTGQQEKTANLLQLAGLAYNASLTDRLELLWAKSELAANQGNLKGAAILGEQALQGYQILGVNGPGSFGNPAYSSLVFRQPAMAVELAPQMQLISLPDF
jgi:hypothetical protein